MRAQPLPLFAIHCIGPEKDFGVWLTCIQAGNPVLRTPLKEIAFFYGEHVFLLNEVYARKLRDYLDEILNQPSVESNKT